MSFLDVQDLRVRYGSGHDTLLAVDGVDLSVPKGQTLGVVGESGCGKSTIARALVGLAPVTSGTVWLEGEDVTSQEARTSAAYRRRVQMIFQDPHSSLNPRMTVGRMLGESVSMRRPRLDSRAARKAEVRRVLDLVGLPESSLDRFPHQFSGGQKQRLAIGRALAVGPEVIICDEVTSALDVSVQATIVNLLRNLQRELGLTYVFISHDLAVVRSMSDDIAVMYLGRLVEGAPTDPLYDTPQHPYTRSLLESSPSLDAVRKPAPLRGELPDPRNPPAGCRFHTRCPVGPMFFPDREVCRTDDPGIGASERENASACHFAPSRSALQVSVSS